MCTSTNRKLGLGLVIGLAALLALGVGPALAGMAEFKSTCADIGFKPGTEKFGECVLKLHARSKNQVVRSSSQARQTQKQNNNQRMEAHRLQQQRIAEQARLEQQRREMQALRRQQLELLKSQQEQARAQENLARTQQLQNSFQMMNKGVEMMTGTGSYAPKAPSISTTNCNVFGNQINCTKY